MVGNDVVAVRADGGLVHIRPAQADDRKALRALNERASDQSIFYRFFTLSRHAADAYVERLLRPASVEHQVLVALIGGEVVGVAAYERLCRQSAEIALLIDDREHNVGIGTLLIEHLASLARQHRVQRFVAEVLAENAGMIRVVRNLGFDVKTRLEYGVVRLSFDLEASARVVAAIDDRERVADAASLHPLLAPRSVAVIGASVRPKSIGHELLRNILAGGFTGSVYVVNPKHDRVLGVPAVASPLDLPEAPDLAIVAVPAAAVLDVVRACGERGARGILMISSGFGETGADGKAMQQEMLAVARQYDMRVIGPNCLGLINTDPAVRLNATFASLPRNPGKLGLVSQSGALGVAVLLGAKRSGLGVSQFVSVGNKADISGNDLLLAWERDERTAVIALYLESFGNPRKFSRIAKRVSRHKPIIAIKAGRSAAGQRAGQSHTAAAASSDAVVDAMFAQAGVLRVDTMEQMLDVARVLTDQPLASGPRVAIVGNSGGPGILAADAAEAAGLTVVELDDATTTQIRNAVPSAASCQNPVDLGAAAQAAESGEAVRIALASDEVDMVLTVFTETLVADPEDVIAAIAAAAAGSDKLVAITHVGGAARFVAVPDGDRMLPVFQFPEPAAAAMGYAWRYARSATAPLGEPAHLEGIDAEGARAIVADLLAVAEGWLGPEDVARLLTRYGVRMCPQRVVSEMDDAVRAADELGYPVAVKLAGGAVHKTDVGGVRLGIADEAQLRLAFDGVQTAGSAASQVLIQPMAPSGGTELIAGVLQDPQFGPVLMLGAGGVLADMIADRQFRLAPITIQDADQMIASMRTAPLLDGYRGRPVVSRRAVRELVLRLAALAEDLPEVAELDLNPVICSGEDLVVVDAKVRIAAAPPSADPVLRQLRG